MASHRSIVAPLIGVATFVSLVGTAHDYGLTLDEPVYVQSADGVARWFRGLGSGPDFFASFRDDVLRNQWQFARPENLNLPVPAILSAAGHELTQWWLEPLASYRVGHAALVAITIAILSFHLSGNPAYGGGWPAAAVGTAALLSMPRVFAHAHLNATDVPVSCFWLLTIVAWLNAESSWKRGLVAAVPCGVGLATKATFVLLPTILIAWMIIFRRWTWWRSAITLGIAAPIVMLMLSPMWWHDVTRAVDYFRAVSGSETIWKIETFYLGETYIAGVRPLPWHSGAVLLLTTTPPWTLALVISGAMAWAWRRDHHIALWLMAAAALPLLRFLPNTPGHDGVRLLFPSVFCFAPVAAFGFHAIIDRINLRHRSADATTSPIAGEPAIGGWPSRIAIGFVLLGAGHVAWWHPHQMSYYSEAIGGLAGAERLGFEVSYWFEGLSPDSLNEIQKRLPRGVRVWTFPHYTGYPLLRKWGLWRSDLLDGDVGNADHLILYARRSRFYAIPGIEETYRHGRPVWSARCQNVQIVGLYAL